jgi:CBS domain-containing protein
MHLGDVMSRRPTTCCPDDMLDLVARALWERDVGVVPVVQDARLVGMITDRDVCMAAYTQGRPLHEIRVATVMAREVHGLHPEDAVEDALRLMRERQVRRIPITDDEGRLAGIVSLADLARSAVTDGHAHVQDVVDTLAAVTRPRVEVAPVAAAPPSLAPAPLAIIPAGATVQVDVRTPEPSVRRAAAMAIR